MVTPILYGIGAAAGWGTHDFLAKVLLKKQNPYQVLFTVRIFELLFISMLIPFFGLKLSTMTLETTALAIFASFIATIAFVLFLKGLEIGKIGIVTPITAGWGAVAVITSAIFLNELLSFEKLLLVSLVVIGTIVASYSASGKKFLKTAGAKEAILAALMWGTMMPVIGYVVAHSDWFTALWIFEVAMVTTSFLVGKIKKASITPKNILPFALPAAANLLGNMSYYLGDSIGLTAIVAPLGSTFTIFAMALSYIFLKERLLFHQKLGVAAVIAGIIALSMV